jgi:hypothetical protein
VCEDMKVCVRVSVCVRMCEGLCGCKGECEGECVGGGVRVGHVLCSVFRQLFQSSSSTHRDALHFGLYEIHGVIG